ncbi:MAG: M20/M25/M40 family metallo-hydrolase, partial [Coriobacteriia bacterium]|nr:M20/M25/M40 family metallo-hydrolase [Coriobacteriia bacterium]
GGTATNVVPARITLTGECRSLDPERADAVKETMDGAMRAAAVARGGSAEIAWTREYVGFSFDEDSEQVQWVARAVREVGLVPKTFKTGGGSDGNIFAAAGIPTLVLSCGMGSVHSTSERISIEDLHDLTDLVHAVTRDLAGA